MRYTDSDSERIVALDVAHKMVAAAKTAPKGCGVDKLTACILDGYSKQTLTDEMRKMSEIPGLDFFNRDAANIDASQCIVLIGVRNIPLGLVSCGFCGFKNCAECFKAGSHCAFNITDLGIAMGSAVSIAADNRIDNRIMFSAGKAALSLEIFDKDVKICYGIPLSTTSKSVFFDRDPGSVLL